jgi:hypothetical protein
LDKTYKHPLSIELNPRIFLNFKPFEFLSYSWCTKYGQQNITSAHVCLKCYTAPVLNTANPKINIIFKYDAVVDKRPLV